MERKNLIAMASEAGFGKLLTGEGLPTMWHGSDLGMLERFAELVASAEREACAKIAETPVYGEQDDITMEAKDRVAGAIRARSNAGIHRAAEGRPVE